MLISFNLIDCTKNFQLKKVGKTSVNFDGNLTSNIFNKKYLTLLFHVFL